MFPYYYGASLHRLPAMIQVADLGGPLLVSAVVATVNAGLFELLRARLNRSGASRTGPIAAAAALVLTLAYGAYRIGEVDRRAARAEMIRVGVVQPNMGLIGKRMDPRESLTRHLEQTRDLERRGRHDLIVWPETGFPYLVPERVHNMRRFMPDIHAPLLFGASTSRRSGDRERLYNTAILIDADGEILGTYDKTYLLAFGEYIPLGETFPRLYAMSPQSGRFTPGDHQRALRLGSLRISTLICYEDVIPTFVRSAIRANDPHLLVNLTNDSWFGNTTEPWIHLALAKLRAVEHHRSLVRATNSGVSAVVDPVGRVVTRSDVFAADTLSAEVRLMQGGTVFRSLGNWPGWIALASSCWLAFASARPRPHGR